MAKLQAASVSIAYGSCSPRAAAPWDRQTDGSRYRLMPHYGESIKTDMLRSIGKQCGESAKSVHDVEKEGCGGKDHWFVRV